jgi:hypothetical protein
MDVIETIIAAIAVEKVMLSKCSYTFRTELMEVEVVGYMRSVCGLNDPRERYYYTAIIKRPARMAKEYDFSLLLPAKDTLTVNVVRMLNKGWKPPMFPKGINVIDRRL